MASHSSVHSEHKALSAFGRSFPRLIQKSLKSSSPVIQVNLKYQYTLKLCDRNERLDGLSWGEPLISDILALDQVLVCSGGRILTQIPVQPRMSQ